MPPTIHLVPALLVKARAVKTELAREADGYMRILSHCLPSFSYVEQPEEHSPVPGEEQEEHNG